MSSDWGGDGGAILDRLAGHERGGGGFWWWWLLVAAMTPWLSGAIFNRGGRRRADHRIRGSGMPHLVLKVTPVVTPAPVCGFRQADVVEMGDRWLRVYRRLAQELKAKRSQLARAAHIPRAELPSCWPVRRCAASACRGRTLSNFHPDPSPQRLGYPREPCRIR
jgi:hypothetical protein